MPSLWRVIRQLFTLLTCTVHLRCPVQAGHVRAHVANSLIAHDEALLSIAVPEPEPEGCRCDEPWSSGYTVDDCLGSGNTGGSPNCIIRTDGPSSVSSTHNNTKKSSRAPRRQSLWIVPCRPLALATISASQRSHVLHISKHSTSQTRHLHSRCRGDLFSGFVEPSRNLTCRPLKYLLVSRTVCCSTRLSYLVFRVIQATAIQWMKYLATKLPSTETSPS